MVKRKLSDVLRAETNKSQDKTGGDRATGSDSATASTPKQKPAARTRKRTANPISPPPEDTTMTATDTPTRRKAPTKADLEKLVGEMKAALQESSEKEERLTEQNSDLQSQLDKANTAMKEMKDYLDRATQLKADLDRVTQEHKDLTQKNAALTKEVNALKKSQPSAKKAPAKKAPSTSLARREAAHRATIEREMHRDSAQRPVGESLSPTQTGEDFTKQTWLL
ncbi:MAG: hypothetical protein AAFX40_14115 [Cyanobacteria bacterium J06639_1]